MKTRNGEIQVTLRVPYWAYKALQGCARTEYRSLNGQAVAILVEYLAGKGITSPEAPESGPVKSDPTNPWG